MAQTLKIDYRDKKANFSLLNKQFLQRHTITAWRWAWGKQTNILHLLRRTTTPSINSIKRLLAIIMIYKVTSQTDLQRQPERNPAQIQLLFTWLPPPTPSAHRRPRTGNTLVRALSIHPFKRSHHQTGWRKRLPLWKSLKVTDTWNGGLLQASRNHYSISDELTNHSQRAVTCGNSLDTSCS